MFTLLCCTSKRFFEGLNLFKVTQSVKIKIYLNFCALFGIGTVSVKRRQECENKKEHTNVTIVPTIVSIITQQKSNMFTSCIYNKTKSTHFENLDILLSFHCK